MRVFLTGGTGYIGRALVEALVARGDQAVVLSRDAARARERLTGSPAAARVEVVEGDPTSAGAWRAGVARCDAVVNLAGEPVSSRRWNARVRQILRDSRVDATRHVIDALAAAPADARPRVLVNASGIDYYPFDVDLGAAGLDDADEVDERTPPGSTFLARLCRDWEAEALRAGELGVRVVLMRTGVVVGGPGGPLDRWARAFRWFAGGPIGSGRQWFSWIHLDDAIAAYLFALDTPALAGPVNLVGPERVRNREVAHRLGRALGRPAVMPTPGFALRLAVGDFAEYLLHGRPAVPRALTAAGFVFRHPTF